MKVKRLPALFVALVVMLFSVPGMALSDQARRGRKIMKKAQCTRCHALTDASAPAKKVGRGLPAFARAGNCTGCHNWILDTKHDEAAIARQEREFPQWRRYLTSIEHFTALPDLGTLTRKVDPKFVRAYLDAPFDLRPHLDESMVPVPLNPRQKDAVVAYLTELNRGETPAVRKRAARPTLSRIARGRARFAERSCTTCHTFGNARFDANRDAGFYTTMKASISGAPNLRFARNRMPRDVMVRYILDPRAVDPSARMPAPSVTPADAELIADFLLYGDFDAPPSPPKPQPPNIPVLARSVSYDEVHREVLGKICVHCHMSAPNNGGDGGPGNTGGLGFDGVGLDLETYSGIQRGLLRRGKRVSILTGEQPILWQALMRRFDDAPRAHRKPYEDTVTLAPPAEHPAPAMPMALPPLSVAQLSLIKTWLAQGAMGPSGRAGLALSD